MHKNTVKTHVFYTQTCMLQLNANMPHACKVYAAGILSVYTGGNGGFNKQSVHNVFHLDPKPEYEHAAML